MNNEIVIQIKAEYESIDNKESAYEIEEGAQKIIELLKQLTNEDNYKVASLIALDSLYHTLNKEIKNNIKIYISMTKKHSTQIKKTEYEKSVIKTKRRIRQDILSIILTLD